MSWNPFELFERISGQIALTSDTEEKSPASEYHVRQLFEDTLIVRTVGIDLCVMPRHADDTQQPNHAFTRPAYGGR